MPSRSPRFIARARALTIVIAPWVLASCEEPTPPVVETLQPKPELVLESTEASVVSGDAIGPTYWLSVPIRFTVTRNGIQGPVSVELQSAVVGTYGPLTLTEPTETITGQVIGTMATFPPVGDHQVSVIASVGTASDTATFVIRVLPFRMSLISRRAVVSQGATQKVTVSLKTTGSPAITVQVTGVPTGVTLTTTDPFDGVLTFTAAAGATLQTSALTVTAVSGSHTASQQLELTVQAPRPKRPIAFRLCGNHYTPPGTPLILDNAGSTAYANDGEAWTPVSRDQDDFIRFDATDRVSIAHTYSYLYTYSIGPVMRVIHATAAELEQMQCARGSGSRSHSIKVDNADRYSLSLGAFRALSPATQTPISGRSAGAQDLIAAAMRGTQRLAIVRRNADLASGDTVKLDFTSAEATLLDSATYAVTPNPPTLVAPRLHTGTTIGSLAGAYPATPAGWYWSVPEAMLASSDVQSVMLTRTDQQTTFGLVQYFRTASPLTGAFGPAVSSAVVDTAANVITLPSQAEYPDVAGVGQRFVLDGRGVYNDVEVWQTKGYAGGTPSTWTFAAPDFALIQFRSRPWQIGSASAGAASIAGGSPAVFFGGTPAAGTRVLWSITNYGLMGRSLPFPRDR